MILFILGLTIGVFAGMMLMALLAAGKSGEAAVEKMH